jgi:hypothetical protein
MGDADRQCRDECLRLRGADSLVADAVRRNRVRNCDTGSGLFDNESVRRIVDRRPEPLIGVDAYRQRWASAAIMPTRSTRTMDIALVYQAGIANVFTMPEKKRLMQNDFRSCEWVLPRNDCRRRQDQNMVVQQGRRYQRSALVDRTGRLPFSRPGTPAAKPLIAAPAGFRTGMNGNHAGTEQGPMIINLSHLIAARTATSNEATRYLPLRRPGRGHAARRHVHRHRRSCTDCLVAPKRRRTTAERTWPAAGVIVPSELIGRIKLDKHEPYLEPVRRWAT